MRTAFDECEGESSATHCQGSKIQEQLATRFNRRRPNGEMFRDMQVYIFFFCYCFGIHEID